MILFVHYYIFLRQRGDPRVRNVKLLLLTATKEGPVVEAIERLLTSAGVESEEFCVPRVPGRRSHEVLNLFDEGVATKPVEWKKACLADKACMAAEAMARYLWNKQPRESAQILFILPGEKEIYDVRNALKMWHFDFEWDHYCLFAETPREEIRALLDRLEEEPFNPDWRSVLVLASAGMATDGWTLYVNGVVDSGQEVYVDDLGFLHVVSESKVSATQREVRAGRVADGLYCRLLEESVAPPCERLSYPEQQHVCLASASLGVPWSPDAMNSLTERYVEDDLISMGLMQRSSEGTDPVGGPFRPRKKIIKHP